MVGVGVGGRVQMFIGREREHGFPRVLSVGHATPGILHNENHSIRRSFSRQAPGTMALCIENTILFSLKQFISNSESLLCQAGGNVHVGEPLS